MMLINIWNVATYESKTLFRSWFFKIFAILALLILFGTNVGFFGGHNDARWTFRAIAANMPYINVLFINVAQAVIAVFLASDFLKRDKKLDTTEVIYARPITNGEYVVGKTLGILVLFVGLVFLALIMTLIFNLIRQDVAVEWLAYLYYPLLISIPTLIFILGLSFFMMILFRSQAVTFLVLLGYISLTLAYFQDKLYGMLDYMAFNLPMVYSDFIGFADPRIILLHRLAYLLMGIGFIFATIRFLNRLPQTGRWNGLNLLGFIAFLSGGLLVGSLYFNHFHQQANLREAYLELNNSYVGKHLSDVVSNKLEVEQHGKSLQINSSLRVVNGSEHRLDTLLFSLNPGFVIDSITGRGGTVNYLRKRQLLLLVPAAGLEPGRRTGFQISYHGVPDESVAYLDIPREEMEATKRIMVAPLDKKAGIIHPDYMLLTPELNWYPVAGVGFNLETFQPQEMDFTRFELTVRSDTSITAIAPGKRSEDEKGVHFNPSSDLSVLPLILAPLERKSLEIDGVEYNLYVEESHDYFSDYFTNIQDTIKALITEAKDNYELDLDLFYPFERINLVEVPIQFHAYERPYIQTVEYILPEMILLPEKGAGINTMDFPRYLKAEERRNRERENSRSPREIETDQFKRLLQNTFFNVETRPQGRGGGNRRDELIAFDGDITYNKNPFCVFPLYYSYVTGISSSEYPVFNSMLEIYLKEGFDVSPRDGFTGGITDKERANLMLSRNNMIDLFARWDTELTSSLINQTGSFIISALKNKVGMSDFDYFFYYYLEDHAFTEISFEQFSRDFLREFGVEVEPYLEVINSGGEMPTFLISEPEYLQTRDDIGDVYLVKLSISNVGNSRGLVDFNFRIMGQGGFGGGGGMNEEKRLYEVEAGETREVQVVLYDRPMMMTINTLISGNIPSSYNNFLRSATEVTSTNLEEYDRSSDQAVSFRYKDEYVVDNEDEGFSKFSISRESKLKQWVDSRKEADDGLLYESLPEWWNPARWTPVAHSAYYGESVRSAMVIRSGDGTNHVTWSTQLPEKGFYDVYVYIPVSAMYKRPSRRQQGGQQGGQGQGPGQGRGFGPEFADKGSDYNYTLSSNEGTERIRFELNNPEDGWNRLGSFHFPADSASIRLTNQTDGQRVIADAVKWVRRR